MLSGIWKQRYERQRAFLKEGRGHFLLLCGYSKDFPGPEPYELEGWTGIYSEEFLRKHAYALGAHRSRRARSGRCPFTSTNRARPSTWRYNDRSRISWRKGLTSAAARRARQVSSSHRSAADR